MIDKPVTTLIILGVSLVVAATIRASAGYGRSAERDAWILSSAGVLCIIASVWASQ